MDATARIKTIVCFAALLAVTLLAGILAWHIPFMLWDHLDLVPMYQGWMAGHLGQTIFWKLHGGHWHTAAYILLLPSAWLTHGHPWLDCLLSWAFLVACAAMLLFLWIRTQSLRNPGDLGFALLIAFLALYPGHFFNLQFGWQVAVFECLFGVAATIVALSAPQLNWMHNLLAIAATILALLSFATAYALFVVAFVMIVSRTELAWRTRLFYLAPWLALGLAVYHFNQQDGGVFPPVRPWRLIVYTFYYLGAGIAHFVPAAAPWLTGFALTVIGLAASRIRDFRAAMPWVALLLFAAVGAALTGMGRGFTEDYATALVQRYVSFSILFWIGWLGFLARAREDGVGWHTGSLAGLIGLVALINAGQMTYEAKVLGRDSRGVAQTICSQWPNLDESFLAGLIYSGAEVARTDLQGLHDLDFAPFDTCVAHPARR